jgi:hypothetical protein
MTTKTKTYLCPIHPELRPDRSGDLEQAQSILTHNRSLDSSSKMTLKVVNGVYQVACECQSVSKAEKPLRDSRGWSC